MIIAFENEDFIVVDKPAGEPVQPDLSKDHNTLDHVDKYLGRSSHLLHRIDRPVHGLVAFAKHKNAAKQWQQLLQEQAIIRKYYAVIEGHVEWDEQVLHHYIQRNGRIKKSFIAQEQKPGYKTARLHATRHGVGDRYTVLDITLDTGHFHQIRAQLSAIGHPVRGDVKYGARRKIKDRSIDLCAYYLSWMDKEIKINPPEQSLFHAIRP